jgi:protocatechuate 3,4-dioxygenase beta subunit
MNLRLPCFIIFSAIVLLACGPTEKDQSLTNDQCDSPDAPVECCFLNMPDTVSYSVTIADDQEPGERLVISGIIYKSDGKTPYPGAILYVYHTDSRGLYSKTGSEKGYQKWHGHLHGWCKTNDFGKYEINTIRPARYPSNDIPAHIHPAIKEPNGIASYYLNDYVFSDDNLVNDKYLATLNQKGGNGVVSLTKNSQGVWMGTRDIILK